MTRYLVPLLVLIAAGSRCAAPVAAQDNPILRQLLEQRIAEELVKHDSEDTAWYNEKSKNKKKLLQMNLFGREIDKKVASWTEESKTWVWLQNPQENLKVELEQFAIRDGRVEFALRATGKVRFKAWGRIQRLAHGAAGGNAWFEIEIGGSAALADNGLKDSSITTLAGTLGGLQFNNDLAGALEDVVEDSLNAQLKRDNEKLRQSLERAIDKVHF